MPVSDTIEFMVTAPQRRGEEGRSQKHSGTENVL